MTNFFITGMARSGTTLLDKMLGSHPELAVLSQPFPYLFRNVKKAFFNDINYPETDYILNSLFDETRYTRDEFLDFLNLFTIQPTFINQVFQSMKGWSGQLTQMDVSTLELEETDMRLDGVYKGLLYHAIQEENVKAQGAKEILCEEFVEYFLSKGVKVLIIIRDPRDVITSLNVGSGTKYGGSIRPTLFHLRNWRKSVAIANTFKGNKCFLALKYEDLISNRKEVLNGVTSFLNVQPFSESHFELGIRLSDGTIWKGNSSTTSNIKIDSDNSRKYLKHLNASTISYIETICSPEMRYLGYELENSNTFSFDKMLAFKEQFKIEENNLDKKMSSNKLEFRKELRRLELLSNRYTKKETEQYLYSMENYKNLIKCENE